MGELFDPMISNSAFDPDSIFFFDVVLGTDEFSCNGAILGEYQQAGRVNIQSTCNIKRRRGRYFSFDVFVIIRSIAFNNQ